MGAAAPQKAGGGRRRLGETLVVLAFLALAALVFQQTGTSLVEQGAAGGAAMFNAAMFPELLGWALIGLGAIQLVAIFRPQRAVPEAAGDETQALDPEERRSSLRKAFLCTAVFLLYLATLRPLGYHLMTPLFMFTCFYILGTRTILLAAVLAIGTSLFMSFVFEYWMSVILPVGRFGIGF